MAGAAVRMGQRVRPGVREGQKAAILFRHPPGRAGFVQFGPGRLGAEARIEEGGEIIGRVWDLKTGHEGVNEGLTAQISQALHVGVGRGADHGLGHAPHLRLLEGRDKPVAHA